MQPKLWYESKTVWLGLAIAVIPLLQALQALPLNDTAKNVVGIILGVLVALNRLYSQGEKVTLTSQKEEQQY